MENLKIILLAYCYFSEFLILEDYILTIWNEVIFLCLRKTKIMYLIYFQIIKRICWKANVFFVMHICMTGVMGVCMMNTPNNPNIKEKFQNLIKGIIENIKVSIIHYRITNKTSRLWLLLFTVLMEGLGSNQERK